MKRIRYIYIMFLVCFAAFGVEAQTRLVQGVVMDETGTVPGVSVFEKGVAGNGVVTDVNGNFKISLRGKSGVLTFTGIGYETKDVTVGDKTQITVKIQSGSRALNEVAIVGFGEQKKITLTGAQSVVGGDDIRKNPSASLQNTLAGRVTGLTVQQTSGQPGSDGADFYIRGQSSFTGNNKPLIIVDDIEYSYSQFSNLDANEVESITLLKDAAQTAIYGIKGANGVMVVTTRRGKAGKPQINLTGNFSLMQPTILTTHLDAYNTALLYDQAQINDNMYSASPVPNFQPRWSAADLALFQNGQDPYGHPNIDWKKELFNTFAPQYKANMDISGGTEKAKYFVSIGYLNQGSLTKNFSSDQGYDAAYYDQRFNYRTNIDLTINKNLTMKVDLYGNINESNSPYTAGYNAIPYEYGSFLALSPFSYPIKNPNGSWAYSYYERDEVIGGGFNNIIERLTEQGYQRKNQNDMGFSTSANQKLGFLIPGLSARGVLAYSNNYSYGSQLSRENLPSFIYTPATDTYVPTNPNNSRLEHLGSNYSAGNTTRQLTAQGFLTYDHTFKNNHISALALYSLTGTTESNGSATYNYVPNNTIGSALRINYDYKQKLFLQVNGAYNGTSRFVGDKRFGLFPSVSAGYNIAEEPFFKNTFRFIDQLKFRGSYGIVGSDQVGGFSYLYLQTYSGSNGTQQASFGQTASSLPANNGIQEGTLSNANVTWEKQKEVDLGLDFALFGSKLTGIVDYFNNNRYDILTSRGTVSSLFGQGLPPLNLGKTNNKGLEVELNYHNAIGKDFKYNFRVTYSYVKNKIVFKDEPVPHYPWQAFTGHPIGAIPLYQFIGFYKDINDAATSPQPSTAPRPGDLKYADLNGDGIIDSKDQAVSDQTNLPTTNYGFQAGFSYKNFSVSVLFQSATGFNVRGYEESIRAFSANLTSVHQQSWTPELGDNAKYPLISFGRGVSDPGSFISNFWSLSGDYLRLRTAEVSYNVPKQLVEKAGLQKVRIYVSGNNLLTWAKSFGLYQLDPEFNPGTDRQNYPPERIFNLGLNVSFK